MPSATYSSLELLIVLGKRRAEPKEAVPKIPAGNANPTLYGKRAFRSNDYVRWREQALEWGILNLAGVSVHGVPLRRPASKWLRRLLAQLGKSPPRPASRRIKIAGRRLPACHRRKLNCSEDVEASSSVSLGHFQNSPTLETGLDSRRF